MQLVSLAALPVKRNTSWPKLIIFYAVSVSSQARVSRSLYGSRRSATLPLLRRATERLVYSVSDTRSIATWRYVVGKDRAVQDLWPGRK